MPRNFYLPPNQEPPRSVVEMVTTAIIIAIVVLTSVAFLR